LTPRFPNQSVKLAHVRSAQRFEDDLVLIADDNELIALFQPQFPPDILRYHDLPLG